MMLYCLTFGLLCSCMKSLSLDKINTGSVAFRLNCPIISSASAPSTPSIVTGKQYSIIQKKYLNGINPDTYLKEHIIKGDRGDGIPNILSDDDTFVSEKRQNKLQKIKIESWIQMDPQEFCNDRMYRNYCRNEQLVSLHKTPSDIIDKIVDLYQNYKDNGRSKLFPSHDL